jgi:hypothetical protein
VRISSKQKNHQQNPIERPVKVQNNSAQLTPPGVSFFVACVVHSKFAYGSAHRDHDSKPTPRYGTK